MPKLVTADVGALSVRSGSPGSTKRPMARAYNLS